MNAQTSNNSNGNLDFSTFINAAVEDQIKIQKAIEAAKKAKTAADEFNDLQRKAADEMVSKIQKDLNTRLQDGKKAQKDKYEQTMCELGLSAEVYPMEMAILAADKKIITPVLANVGKAAGAVRDFGKAIKERFNIGFKASK